MADIGFATASTWDGFKPSMMVDIEDWPIFCIFVFEDVDEYNKVCLVSGAYTRELPSGRATCCRFLFVKTNDDRRALPTPRRKNMTNCSLNICWYLIGLVLCKSFTCSARCCPYHCPRKVRMEATKIQKQMARHIKQNFFTLFPTPKNQTKGLWAFWLVRIE